MKVNEYKKLVAERKACHRCTELTNPAALLDGRYDSDHIGGWSIWQGNLDASLMVVGQDWGDISYFLENRGVDKPKNPTNQNLVSLLAEAGIHIGEPGVTDGKDVAFFTNAILCLKKSKGGLQGSVEDNWFQNCRDFLRRQIEIVEPDCVVGLGVKAYYSILKAFDLKGGKFLDEVEMPGGRFLPNGSRVFARYHCGTRVLNTHRPMKVQIEDWKKLRTYLGDNV